MKRIFYSILIGFALFSCNKQTNTANFGSKNGTTYAEISVKEGGKWEGRKYKGGVFKNVQEMRLNPLHTDHSFDIRYEGPGWENQNIGYRLYLDWRNAVDIYGKKVNTIILPEVGQDGFDSYHNPQPWGQDILKAGKSLGIGGFGRFVNDTVAKFHQVEDTYVKINNAKKSSSFEITYKNWKTGNHTTDLAAKISIYPYDRFSKFQLKTSNLTDGLCAGLVKFKEIPLKQNKSTDNSWGYIATYGAQTLVDKTDLLGMAIFYKTSEVEKTVTGPHDHLVIFKPTTNAVTYYILSAWEQEQNGIKTEADFYKDLDEKLAQLQSKNKLNK